MVGPLEQDRVTTDKQQVHDFWNEASCGENLYLRGSDREAYESQARKRYELEPYIPEFASFDRARGERVLEIGVGLGADHQRFAQAGADLTGIDLTERAVEHTARRLAAFGLSSRLAVAMRSSSISWMNILTGFTPGEFCTIARIRPRPYPRCGGYCDVAGRHGS